MKYSCLLLILAPLVFTSNSSAQNSICVSCVSIRVGRPWLVRNPDPNTHIADNFVNEVALSGGGFRGFTANAVTMSTDGVHAWDMGGTLTQVLSKGSSGSFDECGRWLNDTYESSGTLYGFYHAEKACPYPTTH